MCAFKYLGKARQVDGEVGDRRFLWAVGCALLAHIVAFFGLAYFDQLIVSWYALLAIISAVAAPLAEGRTQDTAAVAELIMRPPARRGAIAPPGG